MAHSASILVLIVGLGFGLYLYGKGYLLNRKEIVRVNKQSKIVSSYNGVVILLIDALKFDFIDPTLKKTDGHWAGNMDVVRSFLQRYPDNTTLFHFEADPPTTTLQRLKGIMTGSFPTFIDAGSNFGGTALLEDNLISQLIRADKSIAFFGDDTWISLFPNHFTIAEPYDSLDVMDLDTVDQGVRKHLSEHIRRKTRKSDVIIAHFLGVDHCGHRYGQNHPEMRRKLTEMNSVIRDVIDHLDEDKLLIVMGDHGMTKNGDHGGSITSEIDAGLFLYSKKGFVFSERCRHNFSVIDQIDLTPTLALLMGIPIPFSNLGVTHPSFYQNTTTARRALYENIEQVKSYIEEYQSQFHDLPKDDFAYMSRKLVQLLKHQSNDTSKFGEEVSQLLGFIKDTCRRKWAHFDFYCICVGLIIVFSSIISLSPLNYLISLRSFMCLILMGIPTLITSSSTVVIILPIMFLVWLVASIFRHVGSIRISYLCILCLLFFCGTCCMFYSNSYIVNEFFGLNYFLQAVLFCILIRNAIICFENRKAEKLLKGSVPFQLLFPYLVAAISLRCAYYFTICREEQGPECVAHNISRPISSFGNELRSFKSWRCGTSTITIVTIGFIHAKWLQKRGNLSGYRIAVLLSNYIVPLIALGWIINNFIECYRTEKTDKIMAGLSVIPIRVSFVLALVTMIMICFKPLMVFVDKEKPVLPMNDHRVRSADVVPFLWNHLKEQYNTSKTVSMKIYGEKTIFSAPFSVIFWLLCLVFVSLLGDGFLYPFLLIFVIVLSFTMMIVRLQSKDQDFLVSITLSLLSHYFFYCLGHQPTLSNIPWHAAFVGFRGAYSHRLIPGLFILLNLFSSFIVISFLLPLTITWKYTPDLQSIFLINEVPSPNGESSVFDADSESDGAKDYLTQLRGRYRAYIFCSCALTFMTMVSAVFFCRHLMVFKIFAPKMMYSVLSLGGTLLGSSLGYILAKSVYENSVKLRTTDSVGK